MLGAGEVNVANKTLSSNELVDYWLQMQRLRHENPELFALLSTGLHGLDNILGGGIEYGQLFIVGGGQKSGKSTFLIHLAKTWARKGIPFVYYSAEMTNLQIGSMLFSNLSGVERQKIRSISLEDDDWKSLEDVANEIRGYKGYWNSASRSISEISTELDRIENTINQPVKAIFVDYLQLLDTPEIKSRSRVEQISSISRGFKRLTTSRSEPMAVVVACQVNRESLRSHLVDANSFLGSGDIERDMDVGIIIHDTIDEITGKPKENKKTITVVGSRETDVGKTQVNFLGGIAQIQDDVIQSKINLDERFM